ncbi:MAG: Acetyl-CoA decarbonylase/synthase complex subunit alpha [Methanomassiliicoccales archaeon PtaU1.Bin124]|nr:MAG: Acetyl-CoA decarbonylase/synthase complex subunit alpha [Methanomassiliicoccales archaeon PtaU1.Bin124]
MADELPEIISVECLRVPLAKKTKPEEIDQKAEERALDRATKEVLKKTMREGTDTVWDRYERQQPPCKYCSEGISCQRCAMGPCRLMGGDRTRGVCGADADLMVARNLLDTIATGAASHSDHGREVVETLLKAARGEAKGYSVKDEEKMRRLAKEYGIDPGLSIDKAAEMLALAMLEEFGTIKGEMQMPKRAPDTNIALWKSAGILPRSIDREVVEAMHRVHMGVGMDYHGFLVHGVKTSMADGWGGSMMGTEISDVMFGTPTIQRSKVNLGVLKHDEVNISLHGHNPILSEMIVKVAALPEMVQAAKDVGANGINIVGLCCTGNELLMRKGIPQAGNHLDQELVITTGALEAMIVDYQCIFPTLSNTAACYHTKLFSTSPKAVITGGYYMEITPENAFEQSRRMVQAAIDNYPNRMKERVLIPDRPVEAMVGFSVEAIKNALGGSLKPLLDAVLSGKIRGCAGIVGCNNPHIKHDYGHVTLAKELIKRDVLCVETGCSSIACAKAGLLQPEAIDQAGKGLKEVCGSLGIPPVLHMGSCVDNSRILNLVAELARLANVRIDQLPVVGAAPEWYSPKAVAIGSYFVGSGVSVCLGPMPHIGGSANVVKMLTDDLEGAINAKFWVEANPKNAVALMYDHIETKRKALGI